MLNFFSSIGHIITNTTISVLIILHVISAPIPKTIPIQSATSTPPVVVQQSATKTIQNLSPVTSYSEITPIVSDSQKPTIAIQPVTNSTKGVICTIGDSGKLGIEQQDGSCVAPPPVPVATVAMKIYTDSKYNFSIKYILIRTLCLLFRF